MVGEEDNPKPGQPQSLGIVVTDGPDYEHPDPGPNPVILTAGGSASFALGTITASVPTYGVTALSITLPGSVAPLAVSNVRTGCSGEPVRVFVTAFVGGSAGPPTF